MILLILVSILAFVGGVHVGTTLATPTPPRPRQRSSTPVHPSIVQRAYRDACLHAN